MTATLRTLAVACAGFALSGCLPLGDEDIRTFALNRYAIENAKLNDGLFGIVSRIDALETMERSEGLTSSERKELKALRKANASTEGLFDFDRGTFGSVAGAATDLVRHLDKSRTRDAAALRTFAGVHDASAAFGDDVADLFSGSNLPPKAAALQKKADALFAEAQEHDQAGRPFSAALTAARAFKLAGKACTEAAKQQ